MHLTNMEPWSYARVLDAKESWEAIFWLPLEGMTHRNKFSQTHEKRQRCWKEVSKMSKVSKV